MIGQLLAAAWVLTSVAFLVIVVLGVRKARARGKRLFRDEVNDRIDKLSQPPVYDHSQDAL